MRHTIALFGEAEKGEFSTPIFVQTITELSECLGNPPDHSRGIDMAVQALMFDRDLIYVRVKEEGFSLKDYLKGLKLLEYNRKLTELTAICLPGVGDATIIDAIHPICYHHNSFLITSEQDLYDYLTSQH